MIKEKYLSEQCRMVLAYLRKNGSMTTMDACVDLNVLSPAKRISELRNDGYNIETFYKRTSLGKRYGIYVLHE